MRMGEALLPSLIAGGLVALIALVIGSGTGEKSDRKKAKEWFIPIWIIASIIIGVLWNLGA